MCEEGKLESKGKITANFNNFKSSKSNIV